MKVLLDTHALVWWVEDEPRLSQTAHDAIAPESHVVFVSAASVLEIATKVRIGRWPEAARVLREIEFIVRENKLTWLPITQAHAKLAGMLPVAHKDPFDRVLAAQSDIEGAHLVTVDKAFSEFSIKVLW